MKLLGFSIAKDNIGLELGSDYFDLHNNFDFDCLRYDPTRRELELCWVRGTGEWVKQTEPKGLRLAFSGVYLFKAHERDGSIPFTEDDCLEAIGFISDELLNEMHGFTSNEPAAGCTHLSALFMSGFSIKIGAESAALHVAGGA